MSNEKDTFIDIDMQYALSFNWMQEQSAIV